MKAFIKISKEEPNGKKFPNEDSLEGYVCSFCSDYNQRFGTRIHKCFAQVSAELNDLFD